MKISKNNKRLILLSVLFCIFIMNSFSAEIITKEALIKRIQSFFKKTQTMTGKFIIYRHGYAEHGTFFSKKPDKIKLIFGNYTGGFKIETKTIVSDGKQLWVYLPSEKVVINQDLTVVSGNIAYSGSGFGIRRMIRKFSYEFYRGDNSLKNERGLNQKVRILRLYNPRSFTGFKELFYYVRNDGLILKFRGITKKNKVIEMIRKDVKLNVDIDNKHFVFRVPKDAQILRNPLVSGG